jgi:hypothetical protein
MKRGYIVYSMVRSNGDCSKSFNIILKNILKEEKYGGRELLELEQTGKVLSRHAFRSSVRGVRKRTGLKADSRTWYVARISKSNPASEMRNHLR